MTAQPAGQARTSLPAIGPRSRETVETACRHYARLAAEMLGAPLGAVQVARAGDPVVYDQGSFDPGTGYDGARAICSVVASQLWFGRTPVAMPDLDDAGALFRRKGIPRGIGAFLAAPLVSRAGKFLGSICAADYAPRPWTTEETDRLRTLAAALSDELELGDPGLAAALSGTETAATLVGSTLGLLAGQAPVDPSIRNIAADTLDALSKAMEELQTMNEELQATRCLVEAEREHYRELFERVPHPYLITDRDGIIHEANERAAALLGTKRTLLVGKPLAGFAPAGEARAAFGTHLGELRGGKRLEWTLRIGTRGPTPLRVECVAAAAHSRESGAERIYWLFREEEEEGSGEATSVAAPRGEDFEELVARAALRDGVPVAEQLRDLIASALNTGALQVGQRLPSIRAIADRFGATSYAALQAYAALEAEGVVERRERSGVYVAAADWPPPSRLPETAEWLAQVLTQACEHQLRIPQLPDLVRRWTSAVTLRCACIESCTDTVAALCHDLNSRFGVNAVPVPVGEVLAADGNPRRTSVLPPAVQEAHLLVTTPFHASRIRGIAEATGKPLLVATMNPDTVQAVETHLSERDLTVVCVDRAAGERIRSLRGGAYRSRVRVLLADELEAAGLDPAEPVFVTQAARQRLKGASLRLVAPPTPAFSLEFARKVSGTLLRLNIDGGRG